MPSKEHKSLSQEDAAAGQVGEQPANEQFATADVAYMFFETV